MICSDIPIQGCFVLIFQDSSVNLGFKGGSIALPFPVLELVTLVYRGVPLCYSVIICKTLDPSKIFVFIIAF